MRKTLFLPLLLLLLWQVPSYANEAEFQKAEKAWIAEDYKQAFKIFKPLAQQGNPVAQFRLGRLYETGNGVPQNYDESGKWYHLSALQGHAKAQAFLATSYGLGRGVPNSNIYAYMWITIAKANGFIIKRESLKVFERNLTATELKEAQKKAQECFNSNYTNCN